jgi:hypothetical protein
MANRPPAKNENKGVIPARAGIRSKNTMCLALKWGIGLIPISHH